MKLSILKQIKKTSYKYLAFGTLSLSICIYCIIKNMEFVNSNIILPIKNFVQECIRLPYAIHKMTDIQKENNKLRNCIVDLKKKLKIIEQQHRLCSKLNQKIQQINDLDKNNIEQVLGFEQGIFNSSLIISLSNSYSKNDYIVISDGLVGILVNAYNNIGLVRTITDSNLYIPVKAKNGLTLVVRGTNDNELVSVAIKQQGKLNIKVGDILYTSGEGGMFPPNIPVSKITQIDLNKQEIKSCPIVDLQNIEFVFLRKSVKMLLDKE